MFLAAAIAFAQGPQADGSSGPRQLDYGWSPEGWLLDEWTSAGRHVAYGYDVAGNRLTRTETDGTGVSTTSYGYAYGNVLSLVDGASPVWNDKGEVEVDHRGWGLWRDAEGQEVGVDDGTELVATVVRDPWGLPLQVRDEAADRTVRGVWGGGAWPLAQEESELGMSWLNLDIDGELVGRFDGGVQAVVLDGTGTPVFDQGMLREAAQAFGEGTTATTGAPGTPTYAGLALLPGTPYHLSRSRLYDPELGRWAGEDPIGLGGGPNRFTYVGNAPTHRWDPSGWVAHPTAVGVGGGLAYEPPRDGGYGGVAPTGADGGGDDGEHRWGDTYDAGRRTSNHIVVRVVGLPSLMTETDAAQRGFDDTGTVDARGLKVYAKVLELPGMSIRADPTSPMGAEATAGSPEATMPEATGADPGDGGGVWMSDLGLPVGWDMQSPPNPNAGLGQLGYEVAVEIAHRIDMAAKIGALRGFSAVDETLAGMAAMAAQIPAMQVMRGEMGLGDGMIRGGGLALSLNFRLGGAMLAETAWAVTDSPNRVGRMGAAVAASPKMWSDGWSGDVGRINAAYDQCGSNVGAIVDLVETATVVSGTAATGKIARAAVARAAARGAASRGLSVASTGGEVLPATMVRTVARGEKIADLIAEGKALTFSTGNEHALVRLAGGERAIISGGPGGISAMEELGVDLIYGHTHPYGLGFVGPSAADRAALEQLGQSSSYVLENGTLEKFWGN